MESQYYYADGKKVPLNPSRHYVAVQPSDAGAAERLAASVSPAGAPPQVFDLPEYNLVVVKVQDGAAASARPAEEAVRSLVSAAPDLNPGPAVYEAAGTTPEEALIPIGEVLVRFKQGVAEADRQRLLGNHGLELRRADYPEPGTDLVATTDGRDAVDAANRLHESEEVEFAQPNFVHLAPRLVLPTVAAGVGTVTAPAPALGAAEAEPSPAAVFNDPAFGSQWNLVKIKAPEAWDISRGSAAVSVAIIDEGCDMAHEDINYKLPGYDAYDGDNNPQPNGNDAHGTACGGVAAMRANNARGGVGVAPECRVMPIRIAKGIGGGFWDTTDAKVADGIRKAVDAPRSADVLSNSYGLGPSTVVTNAFKHAQTNGRGGRGCPIAAAAGNSNTPPVIYPANLSPTIPGFLCVSATNEWDQRKSKTSLDGETWWGSSFGPEVDIAAPGVHIFSPDITGAAGYGAGNYVPNFNGTSSATPHVAGLMGLILSVDPDLRSWEVEDIIKLTADDLGPGGRDPEFGFGRINCRRALEAASRLWYQISVVPEFIGAGKECFMRLDVRMYNPGINSVRLDALTVTSHNPTWTAEIDRFEYRPNPGGVMAPRSGQDVRLNRILLKANGNQASWSYRWALSWSYTFWRPGAPVFPLAGESPLVESEGRKVNSDLVRGGADKSQAESVPSTNGSLAGSLYGASGETAAGDTITVDRQSKTITIVIR